MDANGETGVPLWSSENGLRVDRGIDLQAQVAREHVGYVKQQIRPIANTTWYTLQDDDVAGYGLLDSENRRRPRHPQPLVRDRADSRDAIGASTG